MTIVPRIWITLTACAAAALGAARPASRPSSPPAGESRVVTAVRAGAPISVDGRLDEPAWTGTPSDGFYQNEPRDGEPATEKTDVWIAYDDKALYVAARCHDSQPGRIVGRLGRRDAEIDSDWFIFSVDPYFDRRSGYQFGVNPAGSIADSALSNDINEDETWDGIWEARTAVDAQGWTLEMRIPFHQLRFPARDAYVWGVNFRRILRRLNETSSFAWVAKSEAAFVSRFSRLEGLRDIKPGRRLEISPYTVAQAQVRPSEEGNPFETGHRFAGNMGFDLKAGLSGSMTLDASVNPDFGQVEVDPAVINLSAYETFYEEKRPFFIEGASLFNGFGRGGIYMNVDVNWPSPKLFYSRRIGRAPQGSVTADGFSRVPDRTTILGATKVTGKLGSWNVGAIGALTAREYASIDQGGTRLSEEVEPSTVYGVLRAQKDVRQGQRGYGFMATGVGRNLRTEALSGMLGRSAFSLAADGWNFFDKAKQWVVGGWFGGTRIEGSPDMISELQQSPLHYYQRPDASDLRFDPRRTSLSGWGGQMSFGKQGGKFLFLTTLGAISPGFDPGDMGFQRDSSDVINITAVPAVQWTKPGKVFLYGVAAAGVFRTYNFGGDRMSQGLLFLNQGQLANFWQYQATAIVMPDGLSNTLTRGGPLAVTPAGHILQLQLSTDSRKPIVLEGMGSYQGDRVGGSDWSAQVDVRWKPKSNVNLSIGPILGHTLNPNQYVTRVSDPLQTSMYGTRYVFGRLDQTIVASEIRVDWTFTPRLSLQGYLQPFLAVGSFRRFMEMSRPRAYDYLTYGQGGSTIARAGDEYTIDPDGPGPAAPFSFGSPDFNVKSMRGTIVLRWEYRPGSLLYLVWTQDRADYSHPGDFRLRRDLGDLWTAPGDNIFLLKFSYRWDM